MVVRQWFGNWRRCLLALLLLTIATTLEKTLLWPRAFKVWDVKFPTVILPRNSMHDEDVLWLFEEFLYFVIRFKPSEAVRWWGVLCQVAAEVHRRVAKLMAWSMSFARKGTFPTCGFDGEEFDRKSLRFQMRGQPIARGLRLRV